MPQFLLALPAIIAGTAPIDLAAGSALGAGAFGGFGAGSFTALLSGTALGSTLVNVGLSVGLSYLGSLFQTRPSASAESAMVTSNESTAGRIRVYGRCKIGGARLFWANVPGYRISVLAHCQGPVSAIHEVWFGDEKAEFSVGGAGEWGTVSTVSSPMGGRCKIQSFRGTGDQPASAWLASLSAAWTTTHRARGLCYTVAAYESVATEDFLPTYKSNEPMKRVVVDGAMVWDPRDPEQDPDDDWSNPTTWPSTAGPINASLAVLDWLRHPDGRGKPTSRIDIESFKSFADLCGEPVALKHGGTIPRYALSASYGLNEEPAEVGKKMLAACDGELFMTPAGKIGIRGGRWVEPTVIFGADAILSLSLSDGAGRLAAFNRVVVTFVSPDHDYQSQECDPWVDVENEALWGSVSTSLPLDAVAHHAQARRLAKIAAAKGNPKWKGRVSLDVHGLDALTEEVIGLATGEDDLFAGVVFRVLSADVAADFSTVTLEVASIELSAHAWDAATEEGEAPPIPATVDGDDTVEVPTISSITVEAGGLVVVVGAPSVATLRLVARWTPTTTDDWTETIAGSGALTARTGYLIDGAAYDVECAFLAPSGLRSDWSATETRTVVADPTAPDAPTIGTATEVAGVVSIPTVAPNSANVVKLRIWRSATSSVGDAASIGIIWATANQAVTATDSPGAGTWWWWVAAENGSGISSSKTGPTSLTL